MRRHETTPERSDDPSAVPDQPDQAVEAATGGPFEPIDHRPDPIALASRSRSTGSARRPSFVLALRRDVRHPAVLATIGLATTALVAGLLAWGTGRPADHATAHKSAGPGASRSAGPVPSASPSAGSGPLADFQPIPGSSVEPVARLTARGAKGAVVPLDAGFRLESLDGTPAATLAARLKVEPAVKLTVNAEAGGQAVLLTSATPLSSGSIYRFTLQGSGGEVLDTWAFQAKQPLRVVGTLPETHSSEVPLDTGIEITFDQDGVTDAESHVTITPATPGRFEQHSRTLAFVPDRPLTPTTLYSVTVRRGIATSGTGEATVVDTHVQFETAAKGSTSGQRTYEFPAEVMESPTTERPTITLWAFGSDEEAAPTTTTIAVYQLASLDAAIDAFRTLRARPDWTRWSSAGLVDVSGLTRVLSAELPLRALDNSFWVQLPDRLPAGWYLVQQADGTKPIQTVLQVTDVAGYLAVSTSKTLVWANDLATGKPIVGATASSDSAVFGRTDEEGLATGTTPASLLPQAGATCARPCDPVVVVRTTDGRRIFLPIGAGRDKLEGSGDVYWWSEADDEIWTIFSTDRSRYRAGDTVNVWGFARERDRDRAVAEVTIRLATSNEAEGAPPVATLVERPTAAGAFSGSIPLAGLPDGYYTLTLAAGGRVLRTVALTIGPIAKPAYRLDVTTGHRVYIAGDQVKVTVGAQFFEGTPVPGVGLRIDGFSTGSATTDSLGVAVWRTVATTTVDDDEEGPRYATIQASPARAEEAEITAASRDVVVFPSSRTIDATARIDQGRVVATGGLHQVAVSRLEGEIADGRYIWDVDPRGAAIAKATVTVTFVELIPVRHQTGTAYDFLEKRVVPVYETEITERAAGTVRVTTSDTGTWSASVPASTADHTYRVRASAGDPDGHVARNTTYASRSVPDPYGNEERASLRLTSPTPTDGDVAFGVGERIGLEFHDPDHAQTATDGSRYLFYTAQRGIRTATVQTARRFATTFPSWGAPNLAFGGVRFTGRAYVGTLWYEARFRIADRALQVDLTTDRTRYAPGDPVVVSVRTRNEAGAPVPATVILRGIDEKLYAIGAAEAVDPLAELYAALPTGVVATYRSHRAPEGHPEGGDTTGGGGDRDDFRDSLLFEMITTASDGHASASFRLSDDLTSWRVTGSAITRGLQAGTGSVLVPVSLPFFVDASLAPEYLASDRPAIAVRTFGTALPAGTPVSVRVTIAGLGFDSGALQARANETVDVPLPALREGIQTVTIAATTGSGSTARSDRLTRTFAVVDTRLTRQRTSYVPLPAGEPFRGGDGITSVLIADASGGRFLPLLTDLAAQRDSARLDRSLAADLARTLLHDRFGGDSADDPGEPFALDRYQALDDGLAIVPYSSSDLQLSALVAIVAPERVDRGRLASYLRGIQQSAAETRERRVYALAGLAGLGESVLPEVRAAAGDPDLTIRERLMLGLAASSLGDGPTARTILDAVVADVGEQSGSVARLRVGTSTAEITEGTALASALAAAVGSPLAPRFWAWVDANPAPDRVEDLAAIAYVARSLDRLAVEPARFAWTIDGARHVVDLHAGEALHLDLTAGQLASLSVERLAGSIGVTTTWREGVEPTAFRPDPDLTIARSVRPDGRVKASDLVVVELRVTFGAHAGSGCREVTELVPSGLAPVGLESHWVDAEEGLPDDGVIYPFDQTGPRVRFCVEPSSTRRSFTLRYVARVITPGTYAWEPAVAQSATDEDVANLTPATSIAIE